MDSIIRGLAVYGFLLVVFRLAGKRTLSQATGFDLVLLLIISETTQEAMVDDDHSMTNGILLILTLLGSSVFLAALKQFFPKVEQILDGEPLIIIDNGKPLKDRMDKARVDEADIISAARLIHGLERLEQIKYAILERNGEISIIPKSPQ